jgi:hypothetical protein
MSLQKASKVAIYRGRLDINKSIHIFQAVLNFSVSNPLPLKFDYLQQPNRSQQLSSICQKSPEIDRIHWAASPYLP